MKYPVLIGPTGTGFSAHSPDVPGVVATGTTFDETLESFRQSVELLFKLIREEGGEIPVPSGTVATIEVDAGA